MKKINSNIIKVVAVCMIIFALCACTARQEVNPTPAQPEVRQQRQYIKTEIVPGVNPPYEKQPQQIQMQQIQQRNMTSYKQKAEDISKKLIQMPEVENARVVVFGDTCLVGYKSSKLSKNANTTKNMIINQCKAVDTTIDKVVVSESADIIGRIERLSNNFANKSMNEIGNEFKQIIQKITPVAR